MKATISPPKERTVYLELSEKEARVLMNTFKHKSGNELKQYFGSTGIEPLAYELYDRLSEVLK